SLAVRNDRLLSLLRSGVLRRFSERRSSRSGIARIPEFPRTGSSSETGRVWSSNGGEFRRGEISGLKLGPVGRKTVYDRPQLNNREILDLTEPERFDGRRRSSRVITRHLIPNVRSDHIFDARSSPAYGRPSIFLGLRRSRLNRLNGVGNTTPSPGNDGKSLSLRLITVVVHTLVFLRLQNGTLGFSRKRFPAGFFSLWSVDQKMAQRAHDAAPLRHTASAIIAALESSCLPFPPNPCSRRERHRADPLCRTDLLPDDSRERPTGSWSLEKVHFLNPLPVVEPPQSAT
ncbi:MAG: hypothetical protein NZM29_08040, partial [Nitrospira sp.]|nr:hypothetical protein [Nitrospira sp.]